MALGEVSPERLIEQLLKVQHVTFATGIPESTRFDEEFFEKVAKPLGIAQTLEEAIEAETDFTQMLENILNRYCKPEGSYAIISEAGSSAETRLYVCDVPNIGKFYVVEYREDEPTTGRTVLSYHFYRQRAKAWLDFTETKKTIEEQYKPAVERGIAREFEAIVPEAGPS